MPRPDLPRQRSPKKTHCMPTHLPDEEALHVAQEEKMDANYCWCDDCIAQIATVAPLSRRRLAEIAHGAPASNYEREQINRAQRFTGCQLVDCPHYGADACCGGAV